MRLNLWVIWGLVVVITSCSGSEDGTAPNNEEMVQQEIPAHLQEIENLKVLADLNPEQEITFT